tara:strand:- start:294 stop:2804 length:2511 start_codon:yes stop_codon:yes gene_type:complete
MHLTHTSFVICIAAFVFNACFAEPIPILLKTQTFYDDRDATAVAYFPEAVTAPDIDEVSTDECRIIRIRVEKPSKDSDRDHAAIIQFRPMRAGVIELPTLEFKSETKSLTTAATQLTVSERVKSDRMQLKFIVDTQGDLYVGQAVRIDLEWKSDLPASALRSLRINPNFFSHDDVQIVIPRSTEDEKLQMGLPIGGRRVIARRQINTEQPKELGTVHLAIYVKFLEAGIYSLDDLSLECSIVDQASGDFARYAAHFNNGLFEEVDTFEKYERHYATSKPIEISVLELPKEGQSALFSGLFEPVNFELSLSNEAIELGQILQVGIKVTSESPHGMLDLPPLNLQPSLRTHFLVDPEIGRLWHERGTHFKTRLRALSSYLSAFPALRFQVFDPKTSRYVWKETDPQAIKISSRDGVNYVALNSFEGAQIPLVDFNEGIWYNHNRSMVSSLLHTIYSLLNDYFWLILATGPMVFLALRPLTKERRQQALDPIYKKRARAYAQFKKLPEGSEPKWQAFLNFLAAHCDAKGGAWTASDTRAALEEANVCSKIIAKIEAIHVSKDKTLFSQNKEATEISELNATARRVRVAFAKNTLVLVALLSLLPNESVAASWSEAESAFASALAMPVGSRQATAFYTKSALLFEANAQTNDDVASAFYNAGNAWFQANRLGRAITAYRNAARIRPFDKALLDNLAAARALTLNKVSEDRSILERTPSYWLRVVTIAMSFCFWAMVLLCTRYESRSWRILSYACAMGLATSAVILCIRLNSSRIEGVIITDSVEARKGPAYAYAPAFVQALHDGLEFKLIEERGAWIQIELTDGRRCWIPKNQASQLQAL